MNLDSFLNMGEEEIASVVAEFCENLSSRGKYSVMLLVLFFFLFILNGQFWLLKAGVCVPRETVI